jgi:aspartyl protease family protein
MWTDAIVLGTELRNLGWSYSDAVSPRLEEAYGQAVRALDDRPYDALALLDDATATLGESAARLVARSSILIALQQPFAALDALSRAARLDGSARTELRRQVLAVAARAALPVDDRIAALVDAAADDPGYAPYQAALGRLYFGEGRYVEATASLETALARDASPDADLATLLDTARQRLQTPGQTIAPLHSSASGLYVYASVDGRPMRFVLDTGATYTALSMQAARSLGLVALERTPQVTLSTAAGFVHAPLVTLGAIDVNGAIVQRVPVVVLESTAPFDGLLGMSFLDHFDVDIDRGAGQMRLVRR